MKRNLILSTMVLMAGLTANAHHSSAPHFDANKTVSIEGVVTEFKLVNPHAWLYLDVEDENGTVHNWNCEMTAASALRRNGWTADLFKPGQTVSVEGIAARRDPYGCSFQSGELDDGTTITRNGVLEAPEVLVASAESSQRGFAGNWQTQPRRRGGGRPRWRPVDRAAVAPAVAWSASIASSRRLARKRLQAYDDAF